ncbi:hypothetical protein [Flagellimonas nanhaiensis]|jgi:hypothetical protein|uniref:Uncharacterized protein n=1 Tax=Flagellimonas nanhaiensis TaxID=2292706 RepID=A0A371JUS9_9FLAO|nr:hypothetical protein [Allomuricauda nanhaiensis]RDY61555.1 hypothetical protein DX873_05190 [Allomuricauda nanhaiensis]
MKVYDFPSMEGYEDDNADYLSEEKGEDITSNSINTFTYSVDKSNSIWIVTFNNAAKIRHHTSKLFVPFSIYNVRPNDKANVRPNQWLEAYIFHNNRWIWSLLGDADHR